MHYAAFFRLPILLLATILALGQRPAAAQPTRRYTSRVVSSSNTFNATNAIGNDPTTKATLAPPSVLLGVLGSAAIRLGFAAPNPIGSKAGLLVDADNLLALGVLSGLVINTYLAPNTSPQQSIPLSSLLALAVLPSGRTTAEFTVTEPFDQLELAAGGVISAYTLGLVAVYADVAAPLPVELVSFRGQAGPAGVALSWQTASELNNSYFAVERAASDEAATFVELGRVAGAGSSTQAHSYQFTDQAPGALGYYRLRQVDADGQAHYGPVVAVRAAPSTQLVAYPSPATATLFVANAAGGQLSVFNQQGQLLRQARLPAGSQQLDVRGLPPGIYHLRDEATGQSTRFVKSSD